MDATIITDSDLSGAIEGTQSGIILIYKKLCPHCQNMQKVIDKFMAKSDGQVSLMRMDSEENPEGMKALKVERVPAIIIVKKGKAVAAKIGLMNPREQAAFYQNA